jgi:hypothetical protein
MEQRFSWEANSFSAAQEIFLILWNRQVHYWIHKSPPPVPVLSQIDPAHAPTHFSKIHFNVILPSISGSSKWPTSLTFFHQNPACSSSGYVSWDNRMSDSTETTIQSCGQKSLIVLTFCTQMRSHSALDWVTFCTQLSHILHSIVVTFCTRLSHVLHSIKLRSALNFGHILHSIGSRSALNWVTFCTQLLSRSALNCGDILRSIGSHSALNCGHTVHTIAVTCCTQLGHILHSIAVILCTQLRSHSALNCGHILFWPLLPDFCLIICSKLYRSCSSLTDPLLLPSCLRTKRSTKSWSRCECIAICLRECHRQRIAGTKNPKMCVPLVSAHYTSLMKWYRIASDVIIKECQHIGQIYVTDMWISCFEVDKLLYSYDISYSGCSHRPVC